LKLDRALLKKILYIMIILAIAPFALKFVLLADVAGAEPAVLFLYYYLKTNTYAVLERRLELKRRLLATCALLAESYCFKPRIFASHIAASCLLLLVTSSILFSCMMWLPPLFISSGIVS